jgi:hypothetical protein
VLTVEKLRIKESYCCSEKQELMAEFLRAVDIGARKDEGLDISAEQGTGEDHATGKKHSANRENFKRVIVEDTKLLLSNVAVRESYKVRLYVCRSHLKVEYLCSDENLGSMPSLKTS